MNTQKFFILIVITIGLSACTGEHSVFDKNSKYYFDGSISREVLENYLDRSVTAGYFLTPGAPENYLFPFREDDIRMLQNIGAKFIGRSIYRWSEESKLGDPVFLEYGKRLIERMHEYDPEIIFQACIFEWVSADVDKLAIPAWVFEAFDLPVEKRNFSKAEMVKRIDPNALAAMSGNCPMVNNIETKLWFYFLAKSYIDIGIEAFHLGQVNVISRDDPDKTHYKEILDRIRDYAKKNARRHYVLLDGHTPFDGFVKDGISLLDFNSFPLRIKEVEDRPMEGILELGTNDRMYIYSCPTCNGQIVSGKTLNTTFCPYCGNPMIITDRFYGIYKKSPGAISPSGWEAESMPYLVEFDNWGMRRNPPPGVANVDDFFCWGYDEISWFALQEEAYRNQWLWYAFDWLRETDPNGHLQMCVIRMISHSDNNNTYRSYFANTKSVACPVGYSQEETIKEIWNKRLK